LGRQCAEDAASFSTSGIYGKSGGLLARTSLSETVLTIDRPAIAWLERHFRILATIGAYCRVHLSVRAEPPATSPCVSATLATFRLVGEASLGVIRLVVSAEDERIPTLHTRQLPVLVLLHLDSLLCDFCGLEGHPENQSRNKRNLGR
jgi:hypothetical protein